MRKFALGCLCIAVFFAARPDKGGAQALGSGGDKPMVVKMGSTGRPDEAPVILSVKKGYFAEQGLDVQLVPGAAGGQTFLSALATDQIQVVSGAPNSGLLNALNRGIDIRIVADNYRIGPSDRTFSIVARRDLAESGAIKSIADLKGRAIAGGTGKGAYNELFLHKILLKGGLSERDVSITWLGFPAGFAALTNRGVDAALMIEPDVTAAISRDIGRLLAQGSDIDQGAELSLLYYSPSFAKQTEAATKFMIAFLKGKREYSDAMTLNKNRAELIRLLTQETTIKDPAIWEAMAAPYADLNGDINLDEVKEQGEFYRQTGSVVGALPELEKFIDPSFARAAVQQLGAR